MSRQRRAIHFHPGLLIRLHLSGRHWLNRNPLEGRPAKEWTDEMKQCARRNSFPIWLFPRRLEGIASDGVLHGFGANGCSASSGLRPAFPFRPQHVLQKSGAVDVARRGQAVLRPGGNTGAASSADEVGTLQRGRHAQRRLGVAQELQAEAEQRKARVRSAGSPQSAALDV